MIAGGAAYTIITVVLVAVIVFLLCKVRKLKETGNVAVNRKDSEYNVYSDWGASDYNSTYVNT